MQLDYVGRYYGLEPITSLRSALYYRRASSGAEKNESVALAFNFHNLAEFLAAKKREGLTGYDALVDEMRRVFPDFRGIEIVKTKYGEETVVDFLAAEPVDLCGIHPSELAFLASIIDTRRTPLFCKTNYLFYPDVERYLPPVAFFRILNQTQQNVVATTFNPEFAAAVYRAARIVGAACNFVFCCENFLDGKTILCQRKQGDAFGGRVGVLFQRRRRKRWSDNR
ncbi:MAG: hypothetical protein IJO06_07825 [Thermoguttaceae bacterium]|nr:hypothetical protein [Thermoguttaceae bacterium]